MAFDIEFLKRIRLHEINQAMKYMQPGQIILEVGAGAGWQAQYLSDHGFRVIAIDLPNTLYARDAVYPVIPYDGRIIPLADSSVDVVYSSSVLEHIGPLEEFLAELKRTLKPGGRAIHLMPTPAWRLWTTIGHYIALINVLQRNAQDKVRSQDSAMNGSVPACQRGPVSRGRRSVVRRLQSAVYVQPHGEVGNAVTELYYFSSNRWQKVFEKAGWQIESVESNDLFYTGHLIFGNRLGLGIRRQLSRFLGSACSMYVLHRSA